MTETKFKNYAIFKGYTEEPIKSGSAVKKLTVSYVAPNSPDPELVRSRSVIINDKNKELLTLCKRLKPGAEILVHSGTNAKNYPELTDITKPTDADKSPEQKSGNKKEYVSKQYYHRPDEKPWGMIIQAALSSAIELLKVHPELNKETNEELGKRALKLADYLVTEKLKLEEKYANKENKKEEKPKQEPAIVNDSDPFAKSDDIDEDLPEKTWDENEDPWA